MTPFGAVSLGDSDSRSYRVGTRLSLGPKGLLSLEAERREHPTLPAGPSNHVARRRAVLVG